jgi:hypothetical protein
MEQELAAGLSERQVNELVEDDGRFAAACQIAAFRSRVEYGAIR